MTNCDAIRQRLAEDGSEAAELHAEIRRHIAACTPCTEFLARQQAVDSALEKLPPHDASDALVADTLQAVRQAAEKTPAPARPSIARHYLAGGLAASVVVIASLGLMMNYLDIPSQRIQMADAEIEAAGDGLDRAKDQLAVGPVAENAPAPSLRANEMPVSQFGAPSDSRDEASKVVGGRLEGFGDDSRDSIDIARLEQKKSETGDQRSRELDIIAQLGESPRHGDRDGQRDPDRLGNKLAKEGRVDFYRQGPQSAVVPGAKTKSDGEYLGGLETESEPRKTFAKRPNAESLDQGGGAPVEQERLSLTDQLESNLRGDAPALTAGADQEVTESRSVSVDKKNRAATGPATRRAGAVSVDPIGARLQATNFLQRAQALENLTFQEPIGYWSNSYIPGDPAMRLLQARLRAWDRDALGQDLRLERAVETIVQPFDAPGDAALAVYLHADAPAIEGPTRLRLQVGLKAAERQGGHRPAMNIGLVVDTRSITDANTGARIRALIAALDRVRQPEDRFSLTVAGPEGGLLVPPEQFRHGPLRVAMDRLFGAPRDTASAVTDLQQALATATESVRQGDDPSAVLGSSLVMLVTGSSLAGELPALERIAHRNAVSGVPLSVVSLAARDDLAHIDRLVAAGQGNRRVLDSAQAADALVDREIHAASRAVARALRLRIRLAPGVKLVDVLGSRRLGEPQAQRVREAEQSIDQRLSRNLGIQADRGEDEEGIQIVIPNFYAGDTHVVLLDVIAENPGAIADVTLRYKDVVYLRNGVARASMTVGGSPRLSGPLERNVLKNLVAWEFARQARRVGRALAAGDPHQARSQLATLLELIQGLRVEVAGWSSDLDLAADETMLAEYLTILDSPAVADLAQRRYLADSLRYAAFRKLQSTGR